MNALNVRRMERISFSKFFLLVITTVLFVLRETKAELLLLSNYTISCLDAKNPNFSIPISTGSISYCREVVDWSTANLYSNAYYRHHDPGLPLTEMEQDQVARNTAMYLNSLITTNTPSEECAKAIKWYSCIQTFPYCPYAGHKQNSGISYLPACQLHCDQIREHCGITDDGNNILLCGSRSMKWNTQSRKKFTDVSVSDQSLLWDANANKNCLTFVPYDYRLLPPQRGPYSSLPLLYTVMTALWTATTCGWFYWCSIWRNSPNPEVLRIVGVAFCIRVGLAVICRQLWFRCNEIKFYCPNISVSSADAAFRIFEAGQFCLFFIIGKGWTITRPNLTTTEWFLIILVTNLFLFTSFTFSTFSNYAPNSTWIIFTAVLYGYVFLQLLALIWVEIKSLRGQVRKFNDTMPSERTEPVKMKLRMYMEYFIAAICCVVLECICQIMYASQTVSTLTVSAVYEVCSWLMLVSIAYAFRPRQLSPFFYMVPTSHLNREQHLDDLPKPLPVVSVKRSLLGLSKTADGNENSTSAADNDNVISYRTNPGMDEYELELAPLLPPQPIARAQRRDDGKQALVVVNRDDGFMSIGLNHNALTSVSGNVNNTNGLAVNGRRNEEEVGLLDRFSFFPAGPNGTMNNAAVNNPRIVPTREF